MIAGGPASAAEPDPFYTDLLERGRDARLAAGPGSAATGAVRMLRIACFGLLEAPPRLAACLVELALAQDAAADDAGFNASVRRLVEIEGRFGAYEEAKIDPQTQAAFRAALVSRTPSEVLESVPAFRSAAAERRAARLERLEPAARRSELERLIALEPASDRWRYELAVLKLREGDAAGALADLEPLPAPLAGCRRAEARARTGNCEGAAEDAVWCDEATPESLWLARLRCHEGSGDFTTAASLLGTVPPGLAEGKPFRQARKRIERGLKVQARAARAAGEQNPESDIATPDANATTGLDSGVEATVSVADPDTETTSAPTATTTPPATNPATNLATMNPPAANPPANAPATTNPPATPNTATPNTATPNTPPPPPAAALAPPESIERLRLRLRSATRESDVLDLLAQADTLRARHPADPEVSVFIGEVNYRLRRWQAAVGAIQESAVDLTNRPTLLFYYAVALYESGERTAAAQALDRALPNISQTPFVREYVVKILGRNPG